MTSLALRAPAPLPVVGELYMRHRLLTLYGFALLVLAVPVAAMVTLDPATLPNGASPWVKPVKFLASVGLFALTAAWFFGYVRPDRRGSRLMKRTVAVLLVSGSFELFWILWQAAHGVDSHFNTATAVDAVMFGLMGLFALLLTGTTLPLAWEIARRPAEGLPRDYVAAVVTGLVLTFLLGTAAGIIMSVNGSHAVGAQGAGLPLFGWNRVGGDIRVAHFLGIHAEQIIPAGAVLIAGLAAPVRRRLLAAGTLLYVGLTMAVLGQALAGRPLLPA